MRKVLLGVAMAACLALAACAPPLQSSPTASPELSFNQAPTITHVVDHAPAARDASGYSVKAVWHGERLSEDIQVAAEKKRDGEKTSGGQRGGSGSGSQVSLATPYTLRL